MKKDSKNTDKNKAINYEPLLCPVFSKEQVIAILEKRLEDAFANQYHRNEDARLREAIDTIEALVPPNCFPNGA